MGVPWLNLVRFHREVLRRGEEAFYSLPDTENGRDRWGELLEFRPESLTGPWTVPVSDISHEAFVRRIKSEEITELYIGGPCWHHRQNYRGSWFSAWSPVLCREVRLEIEGDDQVRLEPQQGKWDISPPVFDLLERMSVQPEEELDDLIPELIEQAASVSEAEDSIELIDQFETLLGRHVPELGEKLDEEPNFNSVDPLQSGWTLFVPPAGVSVYIRYLMRDYRMLEEQLEETPDEVGGLELLAPDSPQPEESEDSDSVLPIVPLNDQQESAVKEILGSKPISVVSGPPGCGKSQVVVSTILNAWAEGKKVLFASTTNKAVEVVKERLEEFEEEVPIAVRAGSRRFNNVEESLQRALKLASLSEDRLEELDTGGRKEELREREEELQEALQSDLPQRIDESLRSSIRAYGEYREILGEIEQKEADFRQRIRDWGFRVPPSELKWRLLDPLKDWLERKEDVEDQIEQDERERQELEHEIQSLKNQRNRLVEAVGLDAATVSNWEWLEHGPSPELLEDWFDQLKGVLQDPIGDELEPVPWEPQYDRWDGSDDVQQWVGKARSLRDDIRSELRQLRPKIEEVNQIEDQRLGVLQDLEEHGISENTSVSRDVVREWNATYAKLQSLPESMWDWLPWSERSQLEGKLQDLEDTLRSSLPVGVWRELGEIDDQARDDLSEILEKIDSYLEIESEWEQLASQREAIGSTLQGLRDRCAELHRLSVPHDSRAPDAWMDAAETIDSHINTAEAAQDAWESRERKREVEEQLSDLLDQWNNTASGIPIKEAWAEGRGEELVAAVRALGVNSSPSDVWEAKSHLYTSSFSELISNWKEARSKQDKISELRSSLRSIPPKEDRVREWYDGAPSFLELDRSSLDVLPSQDDRVFQLRDHLEEITEEWEQFSNQERPSLKEDAESELEWAQDHLQQTINLVPDDFPDRDEAEALVEDVIQNREEWPTDDLLDTFEAFNPDRIEGEIETIRHQLTQISFEEAQRQWLERLQNSPETQEAVQELLTHFNQNNGRVEEEAYGAFRKALDALPICLLNAHGPQYVPVDEDLFDVLIIDEATQCTLTNLLPLIYRAKRLAVIGDPEQLTSIPTISSSAERQLAGEFEVQEWLGRLGHAENNVYSSSVSCLPRNRTDVINLVDHYRSHPLIIGFSNREVYQKQLRLQKETDDLRLSQEHSGVFGYDVSGVCSRGSSGRSWRNEPEAREVVNVIRQMKNRDEFARLSFGVVTPFNAQEKFLEDQLEDQGLLQDVTVGTAYKFQGDERDVMIYSPVISEGISESTARWVETPHNQINVSVTRGREALFVIGDFDACRQRDGILGDLIRFVEDVQTLRETSAHELELFSRLVTEGLDPNVHPRVGDIEVDFVLENRSRGVKLAVEVDGIQHEEQEHQDQARDAFLQSRGYNIVRVPTRSIEETPAEAVHEVKESLEVV
ncbi:very-short-patch-repair endonuclease/ElaB/YqjD/DUF883 family membrane-anchored ribosome-binding protein [Salinibacter ruber]|nr:very-short-patch-repair endonuclease/ElaB/YqjD/DUF883 family membrane-anchored ribosome-binding protein [Salinibacter ruber]